MLDATETLPEPEFELEPPETWASDGTLMHDGVRATDPGYGGLLHPSTSPVKIDVEAATTSPTPLNMSLLEQRQWAIEQVARVATGKPTAQGLINEAEILVAYLREGVK